MLASLILRIQGNASAVEQINGQIPAYAPEIGTTWYSLTKDGEQIGYMRTMLLESGEAGNAFDFSEETALFTQIGETTVPFQVSLESTLDYRFQPNQFEGTIQLGELDFAVSGHREADQFLITLTGLGASYDTAVDSPDNMTTSSSLYMALAAYGEKKGDQYRFSTFDPLSRSPSQILVTYLGTDTLQLDREYDSKLFEVQSHGLTSRVWIDARGRLLREESSGYTSELTTFENIKEIYAQLRQDI